MNDRLKYRLWAKDIEMYFDRPLIYINTDGKLVAEDGIKVYEIDQKAYIVEFCTGSKDKEGKLIYEGDIVEIMVWDDSVEDMVEAKGKVYWSKEDAAFFIYVSYDAEYSLNSCETFYGQEIKVIGNIHENKELLDA